MDLETLIAEREIAAQLVRFARAMDARDWPVCLAILTPDATAEFGTGVLEDADAIVGQIRGYLDACGPTQHLLGSILVDIDPAGDRATSRAYVSDTHLGRGARSDLTFSTLGDYHDDWKRIDGVWRLTHRHKHSHAVLGTFDVFAPDDA